MGTEQRFRILRISNGTLIIVLFLIVCLLGLALCDDWILPEVDYTTNLTDGWTIVNEDGSLEAASGQFSIGSTDPVTFYRTLPEDINEDQILRIKCPYYSVDAYVDDECIYHAGPSKLGHITTTVGNVFALIPLNGDYAGKKITLTVKPRNYGFEVLIKDAAITTMSTYAYQRIIEITPYIIICGVLTLLSFLSFGISGVIKFSNVPSGINLGKAFIRLGLFGLCISCWIISDFHIMGMLTGRMTLSGMINYISFMLSPVVFVSAVKFFDLNNLVLKGLFTLSSLNFIVQMMLFITGAIDLPEGLIVSQGMIALTILVVIYIGISFAKKFAKRKYIAIFVPTFLFLLFDILAIIVYIKNGKWMFYVALAMTVFAATIINLLLMKLVDSLKVTIELEHVKKIAYCDNLTGLENRRAYDEYILLLDDKLEKNEVDDSLTVVVLDVNGLKKTNDIYGHAAGDELIKTAADCIKNVFGDTSRCFRIGGDEFVVILFISNDDFDKKNRELEDRLNTWKGEFTDKISVAVGKSGREEFPKHKMQDLLEVADKRMYVNKQNYYVSQLAAVDEAINTPEEKRKKLRKKKYSDKFVLSKYTMPVIRQMAEVIPGGFFIYKEDETRELIYQNSKVLEIFGCETVEEFKELTGNTFRGMVHPSDFSIIQDSIDNQIDSESGNGMDHVVYRIVTKDGRIRMIDDYGHFSHSDDYGDIYYVFINDITGNESIDDM